MWELRLWYVAAAEAESPLLGKANMVIHSERCRSVVRKCALLLAILVSIGQVQSQVFRAINTIGSMSAGSVWSVDGKMAARIINDSLLARIDLERGRPIDTIPNVIKKIDGGGYGFCGSRLYCFAYQRSTSSFQLKYIDKGATAWTTLPNMGIWRKDECYSVRNNRYRVFQLPGTSSVICTAVYDVETCSGPPNSLTLGVSFVIDTATHDTLRRMPEWLVDASWSADGSLMYAGATRYQYYYHQPGYNTPLGWMFTSDTLRMVREFKGNSYNVSGSSVERDTSYLEYGHALGSREIVFTDHNGAGLLDLGTLERMDLSWPPCRYVGSLATPSSILVARQSTFNATQLLICDLAAGTNEVMATIPTSRENVHGSVNMVDSIVLVHNWADSTITRYRVYGYTGSSGLVVRNAIDTVMCADTATIRAFYLGTSEPSSYQWVVGSERFVTTSPVLLYACRRVGSFSVAVTALDSSGNVMATRAGRDLVVTLPGTAVARVRIPFLGKQSVDDAEEPLYVHHLAVDGREQSLGVSQQGQSEILRMHADVRDPFDTTVIVMEANSAGPSVSYADSSGTTRVLSGDGGSQYTSGVDFLSSLYVGGSSATGVRLDQVNMGVPPYREVDPNDPDKGSRYFFYCEQYASYVENTNTYVHWGRAKQSNYSYHLSNGGHVYLVRSTDSGTVATDLFRDFWKARPCNVDAGYGSVILATTDSMIVVFDGGTGAPLNVVHVRSLDAIMVDQATIVTTRGVVTLDGAATQLDEFSFDDGVDVVRMSREYSAIIRDSPDTVACIVRNKTGEVVEAIDAIPHSARCGVYVKRWNALVVGDDHGFVTVFPLFTPVSVEEQAHEATVGSNNIACSAATPIVRVPLSTEYADLYTIAGACVGSLQRTCGTGETWDLSQYHLMPGVYFMISYTGTVGTLQTVIFW